MPSWHKVIAFSMIGFGILLALIGTFGSSSALIKLQMMPHLENFQSEEIQSGWKAGIRAFQFSTSIGLSGVLLALGGFIEHGIAVFKEKT